MRPKGDPGRPGVPKVLILCIRFIIFGVFLGDMGDVRKHMFYCNKTLIFVVWDLSFSVRFLHFFMLLRRHPFFSVLAAFFGKEIATRTSKYPHGWSKDFPRDPPEPPKSTPGWPKGSPGIPDIESRALQNPSGDPQQAQRVPGTPFCS